MFIAKLLPKFEKWLRDDQDRSELTVTAYVVDIQNFATWFTQTQGREAHVENIAPTDIKDYRAWLQTTQQQKPSSVNRRLAALRAILQVGCPGRPHRAQSTKWPQAVAPARAAAEVARTASSSINSSKHLNCTRQQFQRRRCCGLFERLLYRDVAMVMMMWKAGLRVSEVAALDRRDVKIQSSKRGTVAVRAGKGHKARTVPLNADVIESLNTWFKIHPAVSKPVLFVSRSDIRITSRDTGDRRADRT